MDALQMAQNRLYEAEQAFDTSERKDGNAFYRGLSEKYYGEAAIYAAVAQAEQLKRIADALYAKMGSDEMAIADYVAGIFDEVSKK